ncbi:MAG: hypothetical protein GX192_04670 [Clostridiales bacterium]|nr:hypothetical protein [Clostridiales bacterium]
MKSSLTMRLIIFSVSLFLLLSLGASFALGADGLVSPALGVIAENMTMVKTGYSYSDITFTKEDFDFALGREAKSITILTLPNAADGTLYLGSVPVTINQTVSRDNLSKLIFSSSGEGTVETSFYFTAGGYYAIPCQLKIIDTVNFAPSISSDSVALSVETMKNVAYYGSISATDPEGDALKFVITKYPEKGTVTLTDPAHGSFKYVPNAGKKGKDSFSIAVCDEYGNRSEEVTVKINITKNKSGVEYADMNEHWAYNAAIKMTEAGIMGGAAVNGKTYFYPDAAVSREQFVVMLMKTIGLKDVPEVRKTVFADDDEISDGARSYIAAAYVLGFIDGSKVDGKLYFYPSRSITRAETAVILQNIIGVEVSDAVPVFADADDVPAWAMESICAMTKLGIMSGTGGGTFSPFNTMTRAQTAQVLCNVSKLVVK